MTTTVQNWAGNLEFYPRSVVLPKDEEEVCRWVKVAASTQQKIRVVGSRHSFTSLIATSDILLSLDGMQGVLSASKNGHVSVQAGIKLSQLGEELLERGLAQENLGDINVQSLAGALSTGTHGTGLGFGVVATQATELSLVVRAPPPTHGPDGHGLDFVFARKSKSQRCQQVLI